MIVIFVSKALPEQSVTIPFIFKREKTHSVLASPMAICSRYMYGALHYKDELSCCSAHTHVAQGHKLFYLLEDRNKEKRHYGERKEGGLCRILI